MTEATTDSESVRLAPFLKWAGGKRWLISAMPHLTSSLKPDKGIYFEPFLGSGAVFFAVNPRRAVLNDMNSDLVNLYKVIKTKPAALSRLIGQYQSRHSEDFYYRMRDRSPPTQLGAAARFLYLNRTCWNGLYRVNLQGTFNVPIGTKDSVALPTDDFMETHARLKRATVHNKDFEQVLKNAKKGDVVFADPPYTVNHNLNGFLKYNERLFSWDDQIRLHKAALAAVRRGAKVVVTNADHESIRTLYNDKEFFLKTTPRYSKLSGDNKGRREITEIIISSFEL